MKYEALIIGIETLINLGARDVIVRGDSKLVINKVVLKYKCISSNLMKYFTRACRFVKRFNDIAFKHVHRD